MKFLLRHFHLGDLGGLGVLAQTTGYIARQTALQPLKRSIQRRVRRTALGADDYAVLRTRR